MIKLLLGGSPCTHWSIAQSKNRETEANGIGWELFLNYRISRDKYQPEYFIYENNKSMSQAIKDQITREIGVEPILINSALVSAQNRQRYYWVGKRNPDGRYTKVSIQQPEDKGILLRDIIESGESWQEKSYALTTRCMGAIPSDTLERHRHTMIAEPVCLRYERTEEGKKIRDLYEKGEIKHRFNEYKELQPREDGKTNTLSTVLKDNQIAQPYTLLDISKYKLEKLTQEYFKGGVEGDLIGMIENKSGFRNGKQPSQQYRIYSCDGKSVCVDTDQRKHYIVPLPETFECCEKKNYPVYEVRNGQINIKGKTYAIRLADGYYIIRKLTVTECRRLQTVPDWYKYPVSKTQAYRMLGNGWTVDVIKHIMSYMPELKEDKADVLSMYDGMSCGQIALKEIGVKIERYRATETDKYAIKTTQENFRKTMQIGDAFQVREW